MENRFIIYLQIFLKFTKFFYTSFSPFSLAISTYRNGQQVIIQFEMYLIYVLKGLYGAFWDPFSIYYIQIKVLLMVNLFEAIVRPVIVLRGFIGVSQGVIRSLISSSALCLEVIVSMFAASARTCYKLVPFDLKALDRFNFCKFFFLIIDFGWKYV